MYDRMCPDCGLRTANCACTICNRVYNTLQYVKYSYISLTTYVSRYVVGTYKRTIRTAYKYLYLDVLCWLLVTGAGKTFQLLSDLC